MTLKVRAEREDLADCPQPPVKAKERQESEKVAVGLQSVEGEGKHEKETETAPQTKTCVKWETAGKKWIQRRKWTRVVKDYLNPHPLGSHPHLL